MTDAFDFDTLTPQSKPVRYGGKRYVVREASEFAAKEYQNGIFRASKVGADGKPQSFEGLADVEPQLVANCLFEVVSKDDGSTVEVPVPVTTVLRWPARVIRPLYAWIKEVSGLDQKARESSEDSAKNLPGATTDTSALPTNSASTGTNSSDFPAP